ncbi:hypothetical protein [Emticicia soli]|uniref:Uncharacterized protein n=1 Tax=Emticicia soli TaxID=2027878 RepID=A0ABW5JBX1_9BACT
MAKQKESIKQKEVVKVVREYVLQELEAKNLDLDDLNISALNTRIRESIDEAIETSQDGLNEIETED